MVLHPHVLRKAQQEMDEVVGVDKLPNFEDRDRLSFLECVLKEVVRYVRPLCSSTVSAYLNPLSRWNPPVPLGLPHRLMEDDLYDGYYIPKGTIVLGNL
jgi:cytochrome P450